MTGRIVILLFRAFAIIAPTLAVLAPKAMAPLFLATALAALAATFRDWRSIPARFGPAAGWLAAFLIWGAAASWLGSDPAGRCALRRRWPACSSAAWCLRRPCARWRRATRTSAPGWPPGCCWR